MGSTAARNTIVTNGVDLQNQSKVLILVNKLGSKLKLHMAFIIWSDTINKWSYMKLSHLHIHEY